MRTLPILIMGLSSILLQIISLRHLLTVFSGNELDIGITLSVWLVAVGIGSFLGHRIKIKNALAISFIVVAFLSQAAFLFISQIRPFLTAEIGETIPLASTIIATIISLFPLCFVLGLQFPLAVSYSEGDAAKSYSLEAVGAFIGGMVFVLLLSGRVNVFVMSATIGVINFLTAVFLFRKKSLVVLVLIPVFIYLGTAKMNKIQWKGFEIIDSAESRYGEIKALKLRDQINVYASGKFQFSYPDFQAEELKAHIPMSAHPLPSRVLIIGGSPAVLREFLKYPAANIDFAEIDPEMINVSSKLLSAVDRENLKDKRVRIITKDARKFIKELRVPDYDLIISNLPEPSTANINRLYTIDFFKEAQAVIKKGGIICLTLPASFGYIGRRMQIANGSIYSSLKNVFRHVTVSSEEYGYIFASNSPIDINPATLNERFSKRSINTKNFQPYIFDDAFSALKVSMVRERLEKINAINSDMMPAAYLYNLMLWADVHGGRPLNYLLEIKGWHITLTIIMAFVIAAFFLLRKKQAVFYSIFTTGYSAMAFSMIIILTYQALFGYVYEMIGLLTALFMIGMAMGAYIAKDITAPLKKLRLFEVTAIVLFITAPMFFRSELFFYVLNLLCGAIAGVQFAAANLCMTGQEKIKAAGRLYAADLIGSFLGAFMAAIFLIPLLGIQNTILSLVFLKAISLSLLFSMQYEKS